MLSGKRASSAIELQRHTQAHVLGKGRLNYRHPGGGRGPDKNDARTPRFAWIPAFAGMTTRSDSDFSRTAMGLRRDDEIHERKRFSRTVVRVREDDGLLPDQSLRATRNQILSATTT